MGMWKHEESKHTINKVEDRTLLQAWPQSLGVPVQDEAKFDVKYIKLETIGGCKQDAT